MAKRKPDYKKLYPGISDEVITHLRKSDRKIEYMEYDLKREVYVVEAETQTVMIIPSREDSYERLTENNMQFPNDTDIVENVVLDKLMTEKLYVCLSMLSEVERTLIIALFFDEIDEVEMAKRLGINQSNVNRRKFRILAKLKKLLES